MYAKAIYVDGKIVTGLHHGEAYSRLSDQEKSSETLLSGFYDENTGRFFSDDKSFYTKSIYLVRHSKPSKGYDEDPDPDLSPEGIDKAHSLASHLLDIEIAEYRGYTSPYLRCLITADIIARKTGIRFVVDPTLADAMCHDVLLGNHASEFPHFEWPTSEEFRFKMEDDYEFWGRLESVAQNLHQNSVVVSHYQPIKTLTRLAAGHGEELPSNVPVASVTYINNNVIKYFAKPF